MALFRGPPENGPPKVKLGGMEAPPLRAALYLRISDDRQDGAGVARQEKECRQLADRLGWRIAAVYTDDDCSAYNERKTRPQYDRMLDSIKSGAIQAVIAWNSDRLWRQPRQLEDYIDSCEECGIQNQAVNTGRIDLSTPSGQMHARMLCTLAHFESHNKAARTRSWSRDKADKGEYAGGPRLFGYECHGMVIRPDEADEIRRVAKAAVNGQSMRSLARELNDRGFRTPRGNLWRPEGLTRLLSNPRLAGLRTYHDTVRGPAKWEPILDLQTHEALKTVFADPARQKSAPKARGGPDPKVLGTRLYVCGGCGEPRMKHRVRNGRGIYEWAGAGRRKRHRRATHCAISATSAPADPATAIAISDGPVIIR